MKKNNMYLNVILISIALSLLVFMSDFWIKAEWGNVQHKIEYHGLLWVAMDHWSIWKYDSDDIPMKPIEYTKIEL